jgi:hypothetical protein
MSRAIATVHRGPPVHCRIGTGGDEYQQGQQERHETSSNCRKITGGGFVSQALRHGGILTSGNGEVSAANQKS